MENLTHRFAPFAYDWDIRRHTYTGCFKNKWSNLENTFYSLIKTKEEKYEHEPAKMLSFQVIDTFCPRWTLANMSAKFTSTVVVHTLLEANGNACVTEWTCSKIQSALRFAVNVKLNEMFSPKFVENGKETFSGRSLTFLISLFPSWQWVERVVWRFWPPISKTPCTHISRRKDTCAVGDAW